MPLVNCKHWFVFASLYVLGISSHLSHTQHHRFVGACCDRSARRQEGGGRGIGSSRSFMLKVSLGYLKHSLRCGVWITLKVNSEHLLGVTFYPLTSTFSASQLLLVGVATSLLPGSLPHEQGAARRAVQCAAPESCQSEGATRASTMAR